jgi:hypothetical protein
MCPQCFSALVTVIIQERQRRMANAALAVFFAAFFLQG